MLLAPVVALCMVVVSSSARGELVTPPWNYKIKHHGVFCLDASADQAPMLQNNTRFSFYALPEGAPPTGGFPLYIDFLPVNDVTHNTSEICGDGWVPPNPFIPPDQEPPSCKALVNKKCPDVKNYTKCEKCVKELGPDGVAAGCKFFEPYIHCPGGGFSNENYKTFDGPTEIMASCFYSNGSWNQETCGFNQFAGELWNARVHQYLIANGVAVLSLNPFEEDAWAWDSIEEWDASLDKPYLNALFEMLRNGSYANVGPGVLNPKLTVFTGYSAGAQMASWMIELQARGKLMAGASVAGAVLRAGGSHKCYQSPPDAVSQCVGCSDAAACNKFGTRSIPNNLSDCSLDVVAEGGQPCCDYCCPANYTESWYKEHPQDYSKHPPVFLAQNSVTDGNADLCATVMYHEEMLAHGASSTLELISAEDAKCFCVGTPGEAAAALSPYLGACAAIAPPPPPGSHDKTLQCEDHTMGFATMVAPLAKFVIKATAAP